MTQTGTQTRSLFTLFSRSLMITALTCLLPTLQVYAQNTATSGTTPTGLAPGAPAGSYSLSGFEHVNLFNGNLDFSLPLLKVGGRGGAQTGVNLTLNSIHWTVEHEPGSGDPETYDPYHPGSHPPIVRWRRHGHAAGLRCLAGLVGGLASRLRPRSLAGQSFQTRTRRPDLDAFDLHHSRWH